MSIRVPGVSGRLAGDPVLRYTASGQAVVRFAVVTDSRRRTGDAWVVEEASVWRCTAWDALAVNIADSLRRGHRVFVQGRLRERSWTDSQGHARRGVELVVEDCGPSLRNASVRVSKVDRAGSCAGDTDDLWAV